MSQKHLKSYEAGRIASAIADKTFAHVRAPIAAQNEEED